MAEDSSCSPELFSLNELQALKLKEKYFKIVDWSSAQWIDSGLKDTKLHRLVNSTKYWKKKLLEAFCETNVILTLHAEASSKFLSSQYIVDHIVAQFPGVEVESYNRFRNPRYLCIEFVNEGMRNHVLENLTNIDNFEVLFLSWAPINTHINIRVHWLPKRIPITRVSMALSQYFTLKFIKLDTALHASGKYYGCGISVFEGVLKPGVTLAQVPHILMVGSLEALITIPIRLPLCLQCDTVGHKAADCPVAHCRKCNKRMPKGHVCVDVSPQPVSYAQKVAGDEPQNLEEQDYDFEDLQLVSHVEFAKAYTPVKEYKTVQSAKEEIKLVKKNLMVDEQFSISEKSGSGSEIKSINTSNVEHVNKMKGAEDLVDTTSTHMEVVVENKSKANKEDAEGFTQVQRKIKASRNKDLKEKERLSKVPIVTAPYLVRPASKPVTRSDAVSVTSSKQDLRKSLVGNPPTT